METSTAITLALVAVGLWYAWRAIARACDAANEVDWGRTWLNRLDGLNRILCYRYHRLQAEHIPLPETGSALLVANHVSGLDPLLMYAATRRRLHFMIAREQYDRFWLRWLFRAVGCIPVERDRRPERALIAARRTLEAGEVVALFPHGKIRLDSDPPAKLKRGVAWLAGNSGCPIYPLRIEGIRGEGMVLGAVFRRSHARVRSHPVVQCPTEGEVTECLAEVARFIDGEAERGIAMPAEG